MTAQASPVSLRWPVVKEINRSVPTPRVRVVRTHTSIPIETTTSKVAMNQKDCDATRSAVAELSSIIVREESSGGTQCRRRRTAAAQATQRHRDIRWARA